MKMFLKIRRQTFVLLIYFFSVNSFNSQCWKQLTAGVTSSFGIKNDGTLWAWGDNYRGQLGDGTLVNKTTPTQIGTASNWKEISSGENHTLALKLDGTLWAWGGNDFGAIGNGTTNHVSSPIQIGTSSDWKSISAGTYFSVGLKNDATLWGWGANDAGQLGLGHTIDRKIPTQIGTSSFWARISAGGTHLLVVKNDGTLWGCGSNMQGCLGLVGSNYYISLTKIGVSNNWKSISAGRDNFFGQSLATKTDGTLWSCGYNSNGQMGNGSSSISDYTPVFTQVGTQTNWKEIASGGYYNLAINNTGTLWAWGQNYDGQLGDGTVIDKYVPTQVGFSNDWEGISTGGWHSIALNTNKSLFVWGNNSANQLGDGTIINKNTPVNLSCPSMLKNENLLLTKSFTLYPNPFKDELFITSENQFITEISIVDVSGKVIKKISNLKSKSYHLEASGLPDGNYLVSVKTDVGVETYKVIKK